MTPIFHIASAADWEAAQQSDTYTTSTRGRTLGEEGFIHCSRRDQVQQVWHDYYRDVREPLVLLTIDPSRLTSPLRHDTVGDDAYPHIYGPLNPSAVVSARPLDRRGSTGSVTTMFVQEMGLRMGLVVLAMMLSAVGALLGGQSGSEWGRFSGAVAGLVVGAVVYVVVMRRRD